MNGSAPGTNVVAIADRPVPCARCGTVVVWLPLVEGGLLLFDAEPNPIALVGPADSYVLDRSRLAMVLLDDVPPQLAVQVAPDANGLVEHRCRIVRQRSRATGQIRTA